jgi:hypothetical protein
MALADSGADDAEDTSFDAYLDALLRGEALAPEEFLGVYAEASGATERTSERLQEVWRLARSTAETPQGAADSPVAVHSERLPFERVGPFRLLRALGEGGMGRVFLARQEPLGRLCAVKVLRHELQRSSTATARLVREGRLLSTLRHESLARVLDAGELDGSPWVALELVPGRSLDTLLAHERPEVSEVVRWGAELADGLAHAHANGIVHRDVKPSNVRITPERRPLLLDFGLARDLTRDTSRLTQGFEGTPSYCAPEQILGQNVDARGDIYGLGATLFEALTGAPPFDGANMERILHAVVHEPPPSLASRGAAVPRDLETIVARALQKSPARRYPSMAAMRDDLRAVLELRPIAARPDGALTRSLDWARRRPGLTAALVTGLVVAVAAFAWSAHRAANEQRARLREAASLVQRAADIVQRYGDGRGVYERARFDIRGTVSLTENRHVTHDELRRLGTARELVADYEALRVSLDDVLVWLGRAERLDPSAEGLRATRAEYWYQRWMDVRNDPDRTRAAHCRARIEELDPDGPWAQRVSGKLTLAFRSQPSGARVHLFRHVSHREPAGERFVPQPLEGPLNGMELGAHVLEALEAAPGLSAGDCIVQVAGGPVEGAVLRRRAVAADGALAWDRLVAVGDVEVRDLPHALRLAEAAPRGNGRLVWASGQVDGNPDDLDLASWCSAVDAVACGAIEVTVLRDGEHTQLLLEQGVATRETCAPVLAAPEAFLGTTPTELDAAEPGFYVALLTLPGHESYRLSFHLDHACEHYAKGLTLEPQLLPVGATPPGFVRVDVEPLGAPEGSYWIQRTEVTIDEYIDFLNSDEGRGARESGALALPVLRDREGAPISLQTDAAGMVELPPGVRGDRPVSGVGPLEARRYAEWLSRSPLLHSRGLVADLPTLIEWRWSAYGGDARKYTFGPAHVAGWVNSRYAREVPALARTADFPVDESPWGVQGLGGGVAEWTRDALALQPSLAYALCGGAWNLATAQEFAVAHTRRVAADERPAEAGFRLVARERAR